VAYSEGRVIRGNNPPGPIIWGGAVIVDPTLSTIFTITCLKTLFFYLVKKLRIKKSFTIRYILQSNFKKKKKKKKRLIFKFILLPC